MVFLTEYPHTTLSEIYNLLRILSMQMTPTPSKKKGNIIQNVMGAFYLLYCRATCTSCYKE